MKNIVYHPRVPAEVRELLKYYDDINPELGDRFWQELYAAIDYAGQYPERHHFDLLGAGLRRSNLKDFPIHFLFRVFPEQIRVTVSSGMIIVALHLEYEDDKARLLDQLSAV